MDKIEVREVETMTVAEFLEAADELDKTVKRSELKGMFSSYELERLAEEIRFWTQQADELNDKLYNAVAAVQEYAKRRDALLEEYAKAEGLVVREG